MLLVGLALLFLAAIGLAGDSARAEPGNGMEQPDVNLGRRKPEGELPQENTKNTKEEFFFVLSAFFCGDFMSVLERARVEAEK